jgi:hypothetical protein
MVSILLITLLYPHSAVAAEADNPSDLLPDWNISATNTVRGENYTNHGDGGASPYPYTNQHYYDEFSLSMDRRSSEHRNSRLQLDGLLNESRYRYQPDGLFLEKFSFAHINGETQIPFGFETGEYYAGLSSRTLQKSLKGIMLEIQPIFPGTGFDHSVIFLTGTGQTEWKNIHNYSDDTTSAVSWLIEDRKARRFSVNLAHNSKSGDPESGTLDRNQLVTSMAFEVPLGLASQKLNVEGEWAYFDGDHDGVSGAASGQNRDDTGLFTQISGKSDLPLTYRFRHERYGQDFRPAGASVSSDRKSYEFHAGWRFAAGINMRLRLQNFIDSLETSNPSDTRTAGINLSGRLMPGLLPKLSGSLDTYCQKAIDNNYTKDTRTRSLNLNLSHPLYDGWNGRMGYLLQGIQDNAAANTTQANTNQLDLGVSHAIHMLGLRGSFAPRIMLSKRNGGGSDSLLINPAISMNLADDVHQFSMNLALSNQNNHQSNAIDSDTCTVGINYSYTLNNNILGLELSKYYRNPDPGTYTDALKIAIFWTYTFERPAIVKAKRPPEAPAAIIPPAEVPAARLVITELALGQDLAAARQKLAASGIKVFAKEPGLNIYETRLLEEIDQRQRVVLQHKHNKLERAALIIEFDDVGNLDDTQTTFEKVRDALVRIYGNPDRFFEKGEFSTNLAEDIQDGTFIRSMDWKLEKGWLRFGIPRRLDGKIRMEIQFARRFSRARNSLWGLNELQ